MLRLVVGLLLLANLAFFSWSRGWLDEVVGVRARGDREPERLRQQVRPEVIRVLPGAPAASLAAAPPACLEAGPFTEIEVGAAEAALRTLAPGSHWIDVRNERPGRWLVYMGPYPDRQALLRKVDEIRRTRFELEEVAVPSEGDFGLSLGRFEDRAAAERALAQAQQRGIRTARVVQAEAPSVSHVLRIERADPALAATLAASRTPALGGGFVACGQAAAPR